MNVDRTMSATMDEVGLEALSLRDGDTGRTVTLVAGLPAREKDQILRRTKRLSEVGNRVVAFYLWDLEARGEAQLLGYPSAVDYAIRRLDLPRRSARNLIHVGEALSGLRKIDEAFAEGVISWSRVRLLAHIATPDTEDVWLATARTSRWEEFELEVRLAKKGAPPRSDRKGLPELRLKLPLSLDPLAHEVWLQAKKKLGAERGTEVGDAEALRAFAWLFLSTSPEGRAPDRVAEAASPFRVSVQWCPECHAPEVATDEGPMPVAAASAAALLSAAEITSPREAATAEGHDLAEHQDRTTPPWMRNEVLARDGFRCTHCRSRRSLMVHHVVWRSLGGPTTPANLTATCTACHVLIHAGCLHVRGEAPHGLAWRSSSGEATLDPAQRVGGLTIRLPERAVDSAGAEGASSGSPGDATLASRPPPSASAGPAATATLGTRLRPTLEALPTQLEAAELRRVARALSWSERRGLFVYDQAAAGSSLPGTGEADAVSSPPSLPSHRPSGLADVIGQPRAVAVLAEAVRAAARSEEALPHTLLLGGPGLGKSSLMIAAAADLGTTAHLSSGPHLRDLGSLLQILLQLRSRDVLGIDEIHALPPRVAEALYEAMEDGALSLPVTDGMATRTLRFVLPRFTLIGATTETAALPRPFVMRFALRELLEWYGTDDLARIVSRAAARAGLSLSAEAARTIARAGRDTPREALALFVRVRIAAVAAGVASVDAHFASAALASHGIDQHGLDPLDRRLLAVLRVRQSPIGQERLATLLGTTPDILREVHEPFLLRRGLIAVTPRGRVAGPEIRRRKNSSVRET